VHNPQPIGPRSAMILARLARVPRFLLVLTVLAVLVGGLLLPGLGGALLLGLIAALTGWLATLSWAYQPPHLRLLRLLVVGTLVAAAAAKLA
jgi:hypothetical protein